MALMELLMPTEPRGAPLMWADTSKAMAMAQPLLLVQLKILVEPETELLSHLHRLQRTHCYCY